MNTKNLSFPTQLSDRALLTELARLAGCERGASASLIAHLAEVDARELYLAEGFSSLFTYCLEVLRLSESGTYDRIAAARAARRFPVILEMLAEGFVNLTTVRLLAPHLTPENHAQLLAESSGKRVREIQELLARHFPQPPVPSSIRKLPTPAFQSVLPRDAAQPTPPIALAPNPSGPPPAHRPTVVPLAPERYRVQFTATAETYADLRRAQELLRHQIPDGDPAAIIGRALKLLVEDLSRKKLAATDKPRPSRGTAPGSRHIPAEVKRAVSIRDGGRCAFVAENGRRCGERGMLQFHHVKPYAVGGKATTENIELRCRLHNSYEARQFFDSNRTRSDEGIVREALATYERVTQGSTRFKTSSVWPAPFGSDEFVSVAGIG